jgi:hypothetical protein
LTNSVLIFQVLGYDGQGAPTDTARRALADAPWAMVEDIRADLDAKEVVIPLRVMNLNSGAAKAALQRVGFRIGRTTITSQRR